MKDKGGFCYEKEMVNNHNGVHGLIVHCGNGLSVYSGKKPYKNLDAAQIASAKVQLTPPDKTVEIEDISELVGYLNDVVIYNQDNSYTEYVGQGVTFTLIMTDGTQTEITAYNPFLIIDGVGYKTKYEPCQALNSYANELLNSGTANVILEEPPALGLVSDNTYVSALLGAYSWQKKMLMEIL